MESSIMIKKKSDYTIRQYWCIAFFWQLIQDDFIKQYPWITDSGIGLAWSNEWKRHICNLIANNSRELKFYEPVGQFVWFYPPGAAQHFIKWLPLYLLNRNQQRTCHPSDPVLPTSGYRITEKYQGKTAYFTGFYKKDKATISNIIVPQTGIIAESNFKSSTNFLIMGPNRGPSKIARAQERNYRITGGLRRVA